MVTMTPSGHFFMSKCISNIFISYSTFPHLLWVDVILANTFCITDMLLPTEFHIFLLSFVWVVLILVVVDLLCLKEGGVGTQVFLIIWVLFRKSDSDFPVFKYYLNQLEYLRTGFSLIDAFWND